MGRRSWLNLRGKQILQEVGGRQLDIDSEKIFVVHGHEHRAKAELEIFLREIGLDPVVLHRETDQGATLIEKFERYSNVGFAVVLLTPDDKTTVEDDQLEKHVELRARQNVILELGFFIGRLGRNRVCCISKRGVTVPSDISGLTYKWFKEHVDEVKYPLLKELRAAGYNLAF